MGSSVGDADLERGSLPAHQPLEPTPQQVREALADVLLSIPFRASKQSQHLLQYLVVQTLEGHDEMLKERIVGAHVFGRSADYDTGGDPIVRVRAADLRKRLAQYYAGEGARNGIRIDMPPGSYRPVFTSDSQRQAAQAETDRKLSQESHALPVESSDPSAGIDITSEPLETVPEVLPNSEGIRWMRAALIGAGLIILVLAAACIAMWNQIQSTNRLLYPWKYEPSVAAFWSGFLKTDQDTDIVISDASFSLVQSLSKTQIALTDYQSRSYINKFNEQTPEMASNLNLISDWNLASPSEFKLVLRLMTLDPLKDTIHVYDARDFMPDLINQHNVILIGSRISNPWDGLFEPRMNFIFGYGSMSEIVNRAPAAGEQKTYSWVGSGSGSYGYSIVAYLPNPDHNGNVLLMEGGGPENTQAAGDFLLSEYQLENFQKMLHVATLPYFELLLKTSWVKGTPISTTIEAYRTYPNLH
jgi:hypothetical protein